MRRLIGPALVVGVAFACTENLPRATERAAPRPVAETPIGLDARPVSATCKPPPAPPAVAPKIGLAPVTTAPLSRPVEVAYQDGVLFVLEQGGKVLRLSADGSAASVVLDVTEEIVSIGEAGLLGIAFHPRFADNGYVFLYYTAKSPEPPPPNVVFQSAVVRYRSADGGRTLDPASAKRILTVDQPYSNHNGGTIAFGPDGALYLGLGDGGAGGDPHGYGQDPDALLGKMIRIDVDGGDPYAIPPDNPFAGGGGRPEIYALGLRNPFRFRFDPVTGDLWAGDVGQSVHEEIDRIVRGGNYGWRAREGYTCYGPATDCPTAGFVDPVVDHGRVDAISITGGVVYRGAALPELRDRYVYGDYGQGTLWSIPIGAASPTPARLDEGLPRTNPVAFAIDPSGEIVFVDYGRSRIVRIVPPPPPSTMPATLAETGCADAAGLFPYDVIVPQWLDGATATRALAIPAAASVVADDAGRLTLPNGAVAIRSIRAEGRLVETQVIARRDDGAWTMSGYAWNDDATAATAVTATAEVALPSGRRHLLLPPAECARCHADVTRPTLGLEAAQLDRDDADFGARRGNPLATLERLGILAAVPRTTYRPLAATRGFALVETRARGYLHANCAFCHAGGALDLRAGAGRICAPSIATRMRSRDHDRMPPVGSLVPDEGGIALVESWLGSIDGCATR